MSNANLAGGVGSIWASGVPLSGQVLYSNGSAIAGTSNFLWDNTNTQLILTAASFSKSPLLIAGDWLTTGIPGLIFKNTSTYALNNATAIYFQQNNSGGANRTFGKIENKQYASGLSEFNFYTGEVGLVKSLVIRDNSISTTTVTATGLTSGGVIFSLSGTLTVDGSNLYWDNTNKRLGIGTNAPDSPLHVTGTATIGDGANALVNLGASNITAGAFTDGLDFNFLPSGGIRFLVQGSDGPGFQAFGGTYATYGGQIYFDFGSVARSLSNRAVFFRDLEAGGATILKIDGAGITVTGSITLGGYNLISDGAVGIKIVTDSSHLLSFWNQTPIVQPTTAYSAASFTANTSNINDDSATWDGYTIGQVVAALRGMGLLA